MNKKQLTDLKKDMKAYLKRWKANRKKTTTYKCQHCLEYIEVPCPGPQDTAGNGKNFWDSLTTCTNCGNWNFVYTYPSGFTRVKKVPRDVE
jgi:hypothetical protein